MLIETFLTHYAIHLTRRYLTFEKYPHNSPPAPQKNGRYLLYIHIPFCEDVCPYCSFVTTKIESSLAAAYFDALKKEIQIYCDLGYCFDSVYIGGGTPTINPHKLAELISFVKNNWPISQISVETNPSHLIPKTIRILRDIGTNRLSVGVQSFNDEILRGINRLKRYGSGAMVKDRLSSVTGMFDTLNIDMIFNFPTQTVETLTRDIEIINEIKPDQITFYPLIVSSSKKDKLEKIYGRMKYGQEKQLYKLIVELLADNYNQESAWCFASNKKMIDEYIVDHDDYAGVGTGSWGYINGVMYSNTFSIQQYINMIQKNTHPIVAWRKFSYIEKIRYDLLLKLLGGTLSLPQMKKKYGRRFWLYLSKELLFLLSTHTVTFKGNNIVLTPIGRYYWVVLMRTLFSVVGDYRHKRISLDAACPS